MEKQREMAREIFDALVERAIEDLRMSGLDNDEIFLICKDQFGLQYARKFCHELSNDR